MEKQSGRRDFLKRMTALGAAACRSRIVWQEDP